MKRFAPVVLAAACGGNGVEKYSTMAELHGQVIAPSCAATAGGCHHSREYPDLHTPANVFAALRAPCNPGRPRVEVFDGCEPEPDELVVESIGWRSAILALGAEEWSGELVRAITVEHAPPSTIDRAKIERRGFMVIDLGTHLRLEPGATRGTLGDLGALDHRILESIETADPNANGVAGARDPWSELEPGNPGRSYLLGRLEGTVPGDRMPRAGAPLGAEELRALACWLETLSENPKAGDPIDYARCSF